MDEERRQALLDEASERYNEGEYEQAISLWNEVIAMDPGNRKAQEGIRMARLLVADGASESPGSFAGPDPASATSADVGERVAAGIRRVRDLAARGELAEALEGCALLSEISPGSEEIAELEAEIRSLAGPASAGSPSVGAIDDTAPHMLTGSGPGAGDFDAALSQAREALAEGRNSDAAEAASRALQIDPSSMEACGILSLAADDQVSTAPLSIGHDVPFGAASDAFGDTAPGSRSLPDPAGEFAVAPGTDPKVADLIRQGQASLEQGRPQEAIEIWSRVFALDRHNAQAGALIDRAKAAIEEDARRVDEIFYRAVDAQEAGRREEALSLFRQVLAISPHHAEARYAIEALEAPEQDAARTAESIAIDLEAARQAEKERLAAAAAEPRTVFGESPSVPLMRPDALPPVAIRPAAGSRSTSPPPLPPRPLRHSGGGARRFLVALAGAVIFVVAGVGAWLWLGRNGPTMEAQATPPPVAQPPAATEPGKAPAPAPENIAGAIHVVPGAVPRPPEPAPVTPDPVDTVAKAAALKRKGLDAYHHRQWAEAVLALRESMQLAPVEFDAQDQLEKAMHELESQARFEQETSDAVKYFAEGDYGAALHKLYRLQQDHPELKEIERWIRNSWYNWGVLLMQAGAVNEAVEKFDEVLALAPNDREAQRARDFAHRYHGRPRDSVYDTFSTSLTLRALDRG